MMHSKKYYKAIHQIIVTGHWITDQVGKDLKEFGMTEPQFNVLRILKGQKGNPITVHEIQEKMVQRSSNVTRIVDKLLDKGFVDRQECPTNRRKMDITITKEGMNHLEDLNQKVSQFHNQFHGNLTEEELETLEILIKKLKGE